MRDKYLVFGTIECLDDEGLTPSVLTALKNVEVAINSHLTDTEIDAFRHRILARFVDEGGMDFDTVLGFLNSELDDLRLKARLLTVSNQNVQHQNIPRLLQLFQFILDKRTRERVFDPAFGDLKYCYATSRQYKGKWERRWLKFAFAFRAIMLIGGCFRVMLFDWVTKPIQQLLPEMLRRWWLG